MGCFREEAVERRSAVSFLAMLVARSCGGGWCRVLQRRRYHDAVPPLPVRFGFFDRLEEDSIENCSRVRD